MREKVCRPEDSGGLRVNGGRQGRGTETGEGFVSLGALAGEALAIEGGVGEEPKGVGGKAELVLRDGQRTLAGFHGDE
jgi:hypothetical protein